MSYTLTIGIGLGSTATGKTLKAQLIDTAGADVGSAVTTGFVEVGKGNYLWTYAAFPDGFRGAVKVYENTLPTGLLAVAAVNPEEAEDALRIKAKTDQLGFTVAGMVDANAIYAGGVQVYSDDGTLQAATSTTATLDAGEPATVDFHQYSLIKITTGAGAGQVRLIVGYSPDGSGRVATLDRAWKITPSAGDSYAIVEGGAAYVAAMASGVISGVTVADKTGFKLAADGLDAISVESGVNARQALSPILAASAGVLSGAAGTTVTIKGGGVATTRITATVDESGNRNAVTLNLPA